MAEGLNFLVGAVSILRLPATAAPGGHRSGNCDRRARTSLVGGDSRAEGSVLGCGPGPPPAAPKHGREESIHRIISRNPPSPPWPYAPFGGGARPRPPHWEGYALRPGHPPPLSDARSRPLSIGARSRRDPGLEPPPPLDRPDEHG